MIIYEAKLSTPCITPRNAVEIKGSRVYFTQKGKRYSEETRTSYAALCTTKEEARQCCIDYANEKIVDLQKQLGQAFNFLEDCKNLEV